MSIHAEIADMVREVIVNSVETIADGLIAAGDEVTAKEAGERLRDPAVILELQCGLVAGFDQALKELGDD